MFMRKSVEDAQQEWEALGFPVTLTPEDTRDIAAEVVKYFRPPELSFNPELVQLRMSSAPITSYSTVRIPPNNPKLAEVVYDLSLTATPPAFKVASVAHEMFHLLIWELAPKMVDLPGDDPDYLLDEEHEALAVAFEQLCLRPGCTNIVFDALERMWSVRIQGMDQATAAAAFSTAFDARERVLGIDRNHPMTSVTATAVARHMVRRFLERRGY